MLLVLLARVAAADLVVLPKEVEPPCVATRCNPAEARECVTSLGMPPECSWIAEGWERVCIRKAGTKAVHVMCRTAAAAPAPVPEPPPVEAEGGCGCAGAPGGLASVVAALALLATRRSRRR